MHQKAKKKSWKQSVNSHLKTALSFLTEQREKVVRRVPLNNNVSRSKFVSRDLDKPSIINIIKFLKIHMYIDCC